VTGASAGIGKAMVQELARHGTELVLVARNADRLERIAGSLEVPAEVLPADLCDRTQLDAVARRCAAADDPIDLLVNNAGIWSFGALIGPSGDVAEKMVALNVAAVVALSRAAAGQMVANRRGAILNISSIAGSQPLPFEAVYAEYRNAPRVTRARMYLETLSEVMPKLGQKVILDESGANILPLLNLNGERRQTPSPGGPGQQPEREDSR